VGLAVSVTDGAGGVTLFTVTVALALVVPPLPEHDIVYVVVDVGETDWVPNVPETLKPLGEVAEQEVELVLDHVKVELEPEFTDEGLADNVAVGDGVEVPEAVLGTSYI
jgi:hypothetical protein